jgi:hypothetical protein
MFKLCDIRAGSIDQRPIALDDAIGDKRSHPEMIALDSKTLKVSPGEDEGSKVRINGLQQ